jgi:hypothetical protein
LLWIQKLEKTLFFLIFSYLFPSQLLIPTIKVDFKNKYNINNYL